MSLLPRNRHFYDKHCFVYCGDDKCDCQRSPHHPDNIALKTRMTHWKSLVERAAEKLEQEKLYKPGERTDEQSYDDAMDILKEEKGNE